MIRFLARYLARYIGWLALAGFAAVSFALLTGMMVVLIEPLFSEVLLAQNGEIEAADGGEALQSILEEDADEGIRATIRGFFTDGYERLKVFFQIDSSRVVYFLPALLVILFLVRSILAFASGYSFQRIGLGVTTDIRNDLYRSVLDQSSRFHAEHTSGEIISRIVNDVTMMQTAVSQRAVDMVQQSLTLFVLLALLFTNNPKLATICFALLPVVVFPIVRFGQGMRRMSHKSQERMADLAGLVAEGVRGHRVVKAFGMEEFEYGKFRQATGRHLRVNLWATVLDNLSSPVIETVGVLGMASLLVYAGLSIRSGEMTSPEFIGFLLNLAFMYEPIRKLNKVNLVLQQSLAGVKRVKDLMAVPNDIVDSEGAVDIGGMTRGIAFEGVYFAYSDTYVLEGLDLTLSKGETVALVGPSGAGKSTIVNLLPRFFDPDQGRVTVDGIDIREVTLSSLRSLIGIVTQETMLFNDTIRNNIAYGRAKTEMEEVVRAAQSAFADGFILELSNGYETVIGESGMTLSGGQRQRLAIARALLKDAPILILDEATSQLDTESEALVQKALYNLMEGRTTLVIAHRLSTIMKADRIIVLERGRIVQQGRHEELLSEPGLYRKLHDLQFEG